MISDKYCFMRPEVRPDETICQYMDLDYLLSLLGTKKYFIRFKRGFLDRYEHSLPLKSMFPIYPAGCKQDKTVLERDIIRMSNNLASYRKMGNVPTSCWTLRNSENALMWLSYTSKLGVCIKSTVAKFISAIDYTGYELACGTMSYHGYNQSQNHDESIFSKDECFADERELRFYFLSEKNLGTSLSGISLPANPKELISEIIMSPRIVPKAASELKSILSDNYGIRVTSSKIQMDNA